MSVGTNYPSSKQVSTITTDPYPVCSFKENTGRMVAMSGVLLLTNSIFQCSTAVVQLTVNQLVVGSIPATGAKFRSIAQSGSASALGAEGRRFESYYSDHL